MRTLQLSLMGAVILMLLSGPGGVVVAGGEEAPTSEVPHKVSGTLQYVGPFTPKATTKAESRWIERDYGSYDRIQMDDTRLSGTLWHVWNRDFIWGPTEYLTEGEVLAGTVELVSDDGSWVGTMRGYVSEPSTTGRRTHHWHIELTGTGAHEGLSALLYAKGYISHRVEGFVFPGVLPEYPDPVEVPAD